MTTATIDTQNREDAKKRAARVFDVFEDIRERRTRERGSGG